MRLTTSFYEGLSRKEIALPSDMMMGGSMPNAAPEMSMGASGGDPTMSMLQDYLAEISAGDARGWVDRSVWSQIVLRMRMDALRNRDWKVGPLDPRKPFDQSVVDSINDVLRAPNPALENNTFGGLWGAGMQDTYVIGHGAIQALFNNDMTPRAFRALDAARLRPNPLYRPDVNGMPSDTIDSPDDQKRWLFQESTTVTIALSSQEVIPLVPYMSTHDRTGLAPLKGLRSILQAELDVRRSIHLTQKYRTPPGVFIMPGAAPGSPERARTMYDLRMAGKANIGFMNLPKDSRFVQFGGINLIQQGAFLFYEIIVKATAAAWGTLPFFFGWTEQDSRANANTQLTFSDRGETAMLKFVRQIINGPVLDLWRNVLGSRADNIWFNFVALRSEDELEDARTLRQRMGQIGYMSINQALSHAGLPEYSESDLGPDLFPFVSQPWVPSRIPGIMLPLKYAAMSFGIVPGANLGPLVVGNQLARVPQQLPTGEDANDENVQLPDEEDLAQRGIRLLRARQEIASGGDAEGAIRTFEQAARLLRSLS